MKQNPINGNYIMSNGQEVSWYMYEVLINDYGINPNQIIENKDDTMIITHIKTGNEMLAEKNGYGGFTVTKIKINK